MKLLNRFRNEFTSKDCSSTVPETPVDKEIQQVINELTQSILPNKDDSIKPLMEVSLK